LKRNVITIIHSFRHLISQTLDVMTPVAPMTRAWSSHLCQVALGCNSASIIAAMWKNKTRVGKCLSFPYVFLFLFFFFFCGYRTNPLQSRRNQNLNNNPEKKKKKKKTLWENRRDFVISRSEGDS
jgi:hypothetical protein